MLVVSEVQRRRRRMRVSPKSAYDQLSWFARVEFVLKRDPATCMGQEGQRAEAHWDAFDNLVKVDLDGHAEMTAELRDLLLNPPPKAEVVHGGVGRLEDKPLGAAHPGAALLHAARRIRNNLFHGGKELPELHAGRDEALVQAAVIVLRTAASLSPAVRRQLQL